MKKRNLIITALAAVMMMGGSIGAYANENNEQIKPIMKVSYVVKAQKVNANVKENLNVVPAMKVKLNTIPATKVNIIEFQDLSEKVQQKLIERYGENAKLMIFASEEMAKKAADGELEKNNMSPMMKSYKVVTKNKK